MPSKTSFFNQGVFRNNMKRFWLIPFSYTFLLFLFVMGYLSQGASRLANNYDLNSRRFISSDLFGQSDTTMTLFLGFFTLVAALAVFSYMHFPKSTAMIHALPIKRDSLFFTNYLSGLLMVTLPLLFNGLILVIYEAAAGFPRIEYAFIWLGVNLVLTVLLYSFAVFAGMFTGHLAAHAVFFLIFNLLAIFLESMVNLVLTNFLFGFVSTGRLYLKAFSPLANLNTFYSGFANDGGEVLVLALYFLAGVLFLMSSMLLYRRRNVEVATDVISLKIVKPIFKYSVTFCSAALLGSMLVSIFNITQQIIGYMVTYLVGGFIGYFASEMLLKKTFKVFKAYKGFLVFAVVLIAILGSIGLDVLGFNSYIPKESDIAVMYLSQFPDPTGKLALEPESYDPSNNRFMFSNADLINNPPRELTPALIEELRDIPGISQSPETIQKARLIHAYIVAHQDEFRDAAAKHLPPVAIERGTGPSYQPQSLYFGYRLKNGTLIERQYSLAYRYDVKELNKLLSDYLETPEASSKYEPLLSKAPEDFRSIAIYFGDKKGTYHDSITDKEGFLNAYRKDILALNPVDILFLSYYGDQYIGVDVRFELTSTNAFNGFKFNGSRPIPANFKNTITFLLDKGIITQDQLTLTFD
ncbi:MAG: hypothetical protein N2376_04325 [Clostridia bacterium]|nr:hypothetical protein [Clostridia bacterium]